ncbi:MAG: phosphatase PAP2 family protein [Bacteroidota bacterium]
MNNLDTQAFLWLNSLHTESLDPVMAWISGKNEWFPLYALIIGTLIWRYKTRSIGMLIVIIASVVVSDQVCSGLLKPLVHRLRPCHEPAIQYLVHVVGDCGGQFGFCSSHAANSFTLVTCLFLLLRNEFKGIKYFYLWAIIISYSRIYVGVHYPLDVLAGAGVGVLAAFICHKIYQYYLLKTTHENL